MPEAVIRALQRIGKRSAQLLLAVCCLLLIAPAARASARDFSASNAQPRADNSDAAIPDSKFAIGDFDGDRQPDLATVETARFNPLRSRYSISFQLSKGRSQTIGVTGPAGGLVLVAQDVNGDRALDLVLVTPWRHETVAILLNDGQGNFSAAQPGQFRIDAASSGAQLGLVSRIPEDRTVLSFQYSFLLELRGKAAVQREWTPTLSRAPAFAVRLFSSSASGRAPPASLDV
jgi:hypothetical protein